MAPLSPRPPHWTLPANPDTRSLAHESQCVTLRGPIGWAGSASAGLARGSFPSRPLQDCFRTGSGLAVRPFLRRAGPLAWGSGGRVRAAVPLGQGEEARPQEQGPSSPRRSVFFLFWSLLNLQPPSPPSPISGGTAGRARACPSGKAALAETHKQRWASPGNSWGGGAPHPSSLTLRCPPGTPPLPVRPPRELVTHFFIFTFWVRKCFLFLDCGHEVLGLIGLLRGR